MNIRRRSWQEERRLLNASHLYYTGELFRDLLQIRVNKALYCLHSTADRLSCVIYPQQYQGNGDKAGEERGRNITSPNICAKMIFHQKT